MQNGSLQQLTVLDGRRHAVLSTMYAPLLQKVRYPDLSRGNLPLVDTQHQQHRVVPLQLHQVNPRHGLPSRASTPHNIARLTVSAPRVGVAVAPVSSTQSRGAQKLVLVNTNAATFKAPHGLVPQVRYSQAQPAIAVKSVTETRFAPRGKKNVRHQVCVPVTPSGDCKRVRINSHVEPRRLKLVSMALNGSVDLSHGVLFIDDVDQLDLTASTTASDPVKADHQSSLLSPTLPCASRYKTELCRSFEEQGTCKYGEKCQFAHGRDELRQVSRHPKYKTEYCRTYHASGFCPYGQRCHFVHDERSCDTAVASQPALTAIYADTDCVRVNQRQRHTVPFTSASFDDALAGAVEQLTASYTSMPVQRSVNSLEALKSDPLNDALMSALACSTPVTQCAGTYEWNDCVAGSVSASTSTSDDSGVLCLPDKRAVCATQLSAEHASIETARRESDGDSDEHSTSTTADVAWFDGALDRLALDENNNVVDENGNLPDNWMVAAQQVVVAPNLQHAQYRHESAIASPDGMSAEKRLPIFETLAAAR